MSDSDSDCEPQFKLYTVKPKAKKGMKKEDKDLSLVPPHIMRIMQQVEDKKKTRAQAESERKPDSTEILRNMMNMMRNKTLLEEAGQEERADREEDIAKISNARDIFKQKEAMENTVAQGGKMARPEKHKRVDVNVEFMDQSRNKAEELRQMRLREMAAMRSARESNMNNEESWERQNKEKSDGIKKQRELEIDMMRMARQQALEDEEREMALKRNQPQREISPSLVAAKNVSVKTDFLEDRDSKVEQMRLERDREIKEMKRAREMELMLEEEEGENRDQRSEATRELEAFRASRGGGGVKNRYQPEPQPQAQRSAAFNKAPRSMGKSDNWMVNSGDDKIEQARIAREREIEMMMIARGQAIEEEEMERQEEEMLRRADAERKAKEMAILVADLQRMRCETARDAEEEARMTRYQEEMLARVFELNQITKGGIIA